MSLLRPVSDSQVRLRHLRASDLPVFAAYHADPDVARFQGFDPDTEAQAAVFSARQATATAQAAPGSWLQLGDCARQLCAPEPRITETGITMAPRWQGQGLARKAVHELPA